MTDSPTSFSSRTSTAGVLPSPLPCRFELRGGRWLSPMIGIALLVGCAAEVTADERVQFFEKHIRPALIAHCYQCHSNAHGKSEGGLLLDSRPAIERGGESGQAIDAGDPDESLLVEAIKYDSLEMPPGKQLDDETIRLFEEWIRQGAVDPRDNETTPAVSSGIDQQAARKFWAFQPRKAVPIPNPKSDWGSSAVDGFILQKLQQKKLEPAAEADRATWLRRVTFDLTGLPPTVEQLDNFISDQRPGVYERVVDRLLASPHYGERWGRYWLDLARYADSNGADENHKYPVAWRYRDYVVSAYNSDKPYDRMVQEQLAGDLLPAENEAERRENLTATGFLVLGPKMLAEQDKQKLVADIVDEQLDTFGKVFLGLTLGCARCHDHKFDPITAHDYYALAGVFHSTKTMEHLDHVSQWNERELPDRNREQEIAECKIALERAQARAQAILDKQSVFDHDRDPAMYLSATQRSDLEEAKTRVDALTKAMPSLDKVMATDESKVKLVSLHVRGDHMQMSGEPLPREVPQVFESLGAQPNFPATASGRLELARWLTHPDHPLTARVMINRIWQGHFGQGLVRSPSNFGMRGQEPTHPELLDWLADEFIHGGWSIKRMHRIIVLSATYRMACTADRKAEWVDPENRFLSHFPRRRLELEPIRDSLLAIAGRLDFQLSGEANVIKGSKYAEGSVPKTVFDAPRRTLYLPINRAALDAVFSMFDYVDPAVSLDLRPTTIVPHQTLFLMNHPLVMDAGRRLASRVLAKAGDTDQQIEFAYKSMFARPPTMDERLVAERFISAQIRSVDHAREPEAELAAWTSYCRSLLLTSEFLYVE